jgi:multidrug efflux pump
VVDDAIVVIENTHRIYNRYDFGIVQSAKYAAGEVFLPVLAGTLTTLAPFFPLLIWPGIVGKFMKNLPITLIITIRRLLICGLCNEPGVCGYLYEKRMTMTANPICAII